MPDNSLRRVLPFVVLGVAVVAVVYVVRMWTDVRAGAHAVGRAASCYYDGAPQSGCPTPRTGPAADTAWLWAAAIDTLYTRAPGTVGPATLIALDERLATLAPASRAATDSLAGALVTVAPALPRATADTLAAGLRRAATAGTLATPIWTVGAKQRRYDAPTAARAVAGKAKGRDEAIPPRGLLALSRPAIVGQWAVLYAERTIVPERADQTAAVERRLVLLSQLPDGRWRAVRIVDA
ncbi:hypothetical protein [Roseisolibacter agri]|nr:hypothetical protein [Roseisolibacter agri]